MIGNKARIDDPGRHTRRSPLPQDLVEVPHLGNPTISKPQFPPATDPAGLQRQSAPPPNVRFESSVIASTPQSTLGTARFDESLVGRSHRPVIEFGGALCAGPRTTTNPRSSVPSAGADPTNETPCRARRALNSVTTTLVLAGPPRREPRCPVLENPGRAARSRTTTVGDSDAEDAPRPDPPDRLSDASEPELPESLPGPRREDRDRRDSPPPGWPIPNSHLPTWLHSKWRPKDSSRTIQPRPLEIHATQVGSTQISAGEIRPGDHCTGKIQALHQPGHKHRPGGLRDLNGVGPGLNGQCPARNGRGQGLPDHQIGAGFQLSVVVQEKAV